LDNTRIVEQTRTYNVAKRLQIASYTDKHLQSKGTI